MDDLQLFSAAYNAFNKGVPPEYVFYIDDLCGASAEDVEKCVDFYSDIRDNGVIWAEGYKLKLQKDAKS